MSSERPLLTNNGKRRHEKGIIRLRQHLELWTPGLSKKATEDSDTTLAVGNAGLLCGYSAGDIEQAVIANTGRDTLFNVMMLPNKPFALVYFGDKSVAERCRSLLVGAQIKSSSGQTLPWFPLIISNDILMSSMNYTTRSLPPGLEYIPDFISADEELRLTAFVESELNPTQAGDYLKNRTALHYGRRFRYGSNDVDMVSQIDRIPDILEPILDRLLANQFVPRIPDQVTVNVYEPGQGIPLHVDTHSAFENSIISLSLGGAVIMDLTRDEEMVAIVLEPKSLLVLRDEARYVWKHGIAPRCSDFLAQTSEAWRRARRISFTFRCTRTSPCACLYPAHCDSPLQSETENPENLSDVDASTFLLADLSNQRKFEQDNVHAVYDRIAPHFSDTRHKPWPRVSAFMSSLTPGSVLLDVGCGNGKYLGRNTKLYEIGCDRSSGLLEICRNRELECFASDILALPFRSESCDGILCIAVIHHLSSRERRIEALRELIRVLVVGGRALVYVWAFEQKKNHESSTYLRKTGMTNSVTPCTSPAHAYPANKDQVLCPLPVHVNRTEFQQQDILVPWHLRLKSKAAVGVAESVAQRYYHVFREGELRECCESVADVLIEELYYDEGNWCVVLQKQQQVVK